MMKKQILAGVAALIVTGSAVFGYSTFQKSAETSAAEIAKEVTVQRGKVTAGVTESAAVNVESLEQTYDLTLTSTSVSASVESSAGTSSRSGGMSMGAAGGMGISGMGGMSMGGSRGSTSVSTQSESSAVALVVDEVRITEGQTVKEGDILMTVTQESIDAARSLLTEAISDAELALKQALIDESETQLSAKYEYDSRIAKGKNAKSVYDAAMQEIAQNISSLESQIAACTDSRQRESLQSQLTAAKSSRSADELAAKQTYEETLMYYENAKSLYDVSVNGVGTASEEATEAVEAAKADLETFEAYIDDGSIRAEYSGTVTSVGYAAGDTLTADTAIAGFADAASITVTVNVTEDDIAAVHLDDKVDISFLSYPDEQFGGYVSKIGSSSTAGRSSTVSYPVTVVVTEVPETLLSGMTANVTFITKQVQDVLYVSNKAVTTKGVDSYVLRKNADGSEEKVRVKVGFSNGSITEISGVSEGDTLLIKGKVS